MFCSKCGNQFSDSAIFCNKCGAQVRTSEDLQVESQSTQPMQSKEKEQKTKKQKPEKQGKVSAALLCVTSVLSMVVALVLYVWVWIHIFNQPWVTVSGWSWVILKGMLNVVWLMLVSAVVINSNDLMHKKIPVVMCVMLVLDGLNGIIIGVLNVIDRVQFWIRAQTSDNVFIGNGFELAVLKSCLDIFFSVMVIVGCILTLCAVKKQKRGLTKILLIFWTISIIYVLAPLLSREMYMMRWQDVDEYFRTISAKLNGVSIYLFLSWLLVKSRQQAKKLQ